MVRGYSVLGGAPKFVGKRAGSSARVLTLLELPEGTLAPLSAGLKSLDPKIRDECVRWLPLVKTLRR